MVPSRPNDDAPSWDVRTTHSGGEERARVLIIDDDEHTRTFMAQRLQRRRFDVVAVESGELGLEQLQREVFDLVLLDMLMPGLSGLETLKLLRDLHPIDQLPVVIVSSRNDNATIVEALRRGASDYVSKPINIPVLVARCENLLAVTHAHAADLVRRTTSRVATGPVYFCARCETALRVAGQNCSNCGAPKPDSGWLPISASNDPLLGTVLADRYQIERKLGVGSAATVYRALDTKLDRRVAAKVIELRDKGRSLGEQVQRRARLEIQAMSKLTSPHIVKIHDVVEPHDRALTIVMDLVSGSTLKQMLAAVQNLRAPVAMDIARQVARGLYDVHENGYVHRDLKPANIMVEALPVSGRFVHILDFGIVRILDDSEDASTYFGTPMYGAPEQFRIAARIDFRADVYSLGAVLFHMLTGEPPYPGRDPVKVLERHANAPIPRIEARVAELKMYPMLSQLVYRMLSKDPAERQQSMFEVLRSMDEVLVAEM